MFGIRGWRAALLAAVPLLALTAAVANGMERLRPPLMARAVEITYVQPGSPAWRAGLEVGDRIAEVDGVRIQVLDDLRAALYRAEYSARLTIINVRNGETATVYVYPQAGKIGIGARMVPEWPGPIYRPIRPDF